LDYAAPVWNGGISKKDSEILEKVQRRATRTMDMKKLPYEQRLKHFGWTDLRTRRLRGDLFQCYKLIHGLEECELTNSSWLRNESNYNSRNSQMTRIVSEIYNRSKARFCFLLNRCASHWNRLPLEVANAENTNQFKARLDAHMTSEKWRRSVYRT
jgi:hypothetical protein